MECINSAILGIVSIRIVSFVNEKHETTFCSSIFLNIEETSFRE